MSVYANAQNIVTIAVGLNNGSVLIYKYNINTDQVINAPVPALAAAAEEEILEAR